MAVNTIDKPQFLSFIITIDLLYIIDVFCLLFGVCAQELQIVSLILLKFNLLLMSLTLHCCIQT